MLRRVRNYPSPFSVHREAVRNFLEIQGKQANEDTSYVMYQYVMFRHVMRTTFPRHKSALYLILFIYVYVYPYLSIDRSLFVHLRYH